MKESEILLTFQKQSDRDARWKHGSDWAMLVRRRPHLRNPQFRHRKMPGGWIQALYW